MIRGLGGAPNKRKKVEQPDPEEQENPAANGNEDDAAGSAKNNFGNTIVEQLRKYNEKIVVANSGRSGVPLKMAETAEKMINEEMTMKELFESVPLKRLEELQDSLPQYANNRNITYLMSGLFKHCFHEESESFSLQTMRLHSSKQALMSALMVVYLKSYKVFWADGITPAQSELMKVVIAKKLVSERAAASVPAQTGRGFLGGLWAV